MELDYFNARVRGLRGRLLVGRDYEALLGLEGIGQCLEKLKSTSYGPDISVMEMTQEKTGDIISPTLKKSLVETFAFVWKIAPERARRLLKAVFSAWEAHNLKAIIRGIAKGVKREELIDCLIPAGSFDMAAITSLLEAKDIKDLISILETWGSPYAEPMKKGLETYLKSGSIFDIELAIDFFTTRFYQQYLGNGSLDDAIIKDVLSMRADIHNIMTVFKIAGEGYAAEEAGSFFIEGGKRLSKDEFLSLLETRDRDEIVRRLSEAVKDGDLKEALSVAGTEDMGIFEDRLIGLVERHARRLSITEPLSIAVAVSFIYLKVREIKNLRLIAMGKKIGIPSESLRGFLIYPG